MHIWIKQTLVSCALGLALWLLWGFWLLDLGLSVLLSVLLIALAAVLSSANYQLYQQRQKAQPVFDEQLLPAQGFQGTLVLVCGLEQPLADSYRELQAGWYLSVADNESFLQTVHWLAEQRPELLSRVAIMLPVLPEQLTDQDALLESVFAWRRAIAQASRYMAYQPEMWCVLYLNPLHSAQPAVAQSKAPFWFSAKTGQAIQVAEGHTSLGTLDGWLDRHAHETYPLPLMVNLEHALQWLQHTYLPLWQLPQAGTPSLSLQAVAVHFAPVLALPNNLWQAYLAQRTGLVSTVHVTAAAVLPFPAILLSRKVSRLSLTVMEKTAAQFAGIVAVFLLLAMLASFNHNQRLIQHAQNDLVLFRGLSGEPVEPKLAAQKQLRASVQQLTRWEREGIPTAYSVALYQGGRLLPPLQSALSEWAPPAAPAPIIQRVDNAVTLDSLALFDVGQFSLKPQANKVLVSALLDVKAKPGWLIVISGHTDSTGSPQANQRLSQQRAESVRDWMLATSDLSANCFAVQGFGDTRPVADNNSEEGRGKNRRVEIRLLPQADACQEVNIKSTSSFTKDDVLSLQMEK